MTVAASSLADWLTRLENLNIHHIELGLARVAKVRAAMQLTPTCPVITLAGTNGKGSTAAFLSAILRAAGYTELAEADAWPSDVQRCFLRRAGSLIAWNATGTSGRGFRMVGAHTDSPNLRLKPRAPYHKAGYLQLGVEVYGGALLNSWLDRDLLLAGRVIYRNGQAKEGGVVRALVRLPQPLVRVPQLAIHLDREVTTIGREGTNITLASPLVSRAHAEVGTLPGGGHVLRDLGSTNGTLYEGSLVTEATVGSIANLSPSLFVRSAGRLLRVALSSRTRPTSPSPDRSRTRKWLEPSFQSAVAV